MIQFNKCNVISKRVSRHSVNSMRNAYIKHDTESQKFLKLGSLANIHPTSTFKTVFNGHNSLARVYKSIPASFSYTKWWSVATVF